MAAAHRPPWLDSAIASIPASAARRAAFSPGIPLVEVEVGRQRHVGDVGGRFFDSAEGEIDYGINRRVVGVSLDAFRRVPIRVAAVGGPHEVEPLPAALGGGVSHGRRH